ncbi:MAG: TolC family protein [Campylobacterales bacterium]|nr:TolC family protein [Campylobacterales bacterium]
MNLFLCVLLSSSCLFAFTLQEYVKIALHESNDVLNLIDNELNAQIGYENVLNRFDPKASPDSYFQTSDYGDQMQIGLQSYQDNIYGGQLYGNIRAYRNGYDNFPDTYGSQFQIGYRQSIWKKFGKDYNSLPLYIAQKNLELERENTHFTKQDQIIKAVRLYYSVLLHQETIAIQQKSLERSRYYYEAAEAKQKSGLVSKIDVYRAQLSYLQQKKMLNSSKKAYSDALDEAMFYINKESGYLHDAFESSITIFSFDLNVPTESEILENDIRWIRITQQEHIMMRRFHNAKKDLFPDLTLDTSFARFKLPGKMEETFGWSTSDWSITLSAQYAFDRHNEEQAIRKLVLERNRLVRDKLTLRRTLLKEVRELRVRNANLKSDLEIELLKTSQSKESLEISRIRFERGIAGNLDVIDAENAYLNAQIGYYNTLVNYNLSQLELLKACNQLDLNILQKVLE